jgi:poly(hydroxyalkanoate) granule-associated protein
MSEATMDATDRITGAVEETAATITHGLRRVWLAGLGVVAVTGEELRSVFQTLEQKGQQFEPAVTAPLRRAGESANRISDRASQTVAGVSRAVGSAAAHLTPRPVIVPQQLEQMIAEKVTAALERLDLPTRKDFEGLKERIEEIAAKPKRSEPKT